MRSGRSVPLVRGGNMELAFWRFALTFSVSLVAKVQFTVAAHTGLS